MAPLPQKVRDIMTANPRSVPPSAPVSAAYSLMIEGGFRHVVVVDGQRVAGMLSDRDILRAMPPPSTATVADQGRFFASEVRALMTAPALSLRPDEPITTAVDLMVNEHISALPVTDTEGRLLGVVTLVDLARLLRRALS